MRSYLAYVLGLVALVILTGAVGFYAAEFGRNPNIDSFGDALWWAVVTVTTVGYGDYFPITPIGRLFGAFLMFSGIGALGLFTAAVAAYLVKFDRLDALKIRRVNGHVVICGLGAMGVLLAQAFRRDGYQVLAIEKTEENPHVAAAREAGAAVLVGDAARVEVLRRARLDRAKHWSSSQGPTRTTSRLPPRRGPCRGSEVRTSPVRRKSRTRTCGTRYAAGTWGRGMDSVSSSSM